MKSKGKVKKQNKIKVMEIDMMRIDPGAIGFTSGFSQEHKYSMVGEQITVEQLTELSIVMRISRHDLLEICPRGNNKVMEIDMMRKRPKGHRFH